MSKEKILNRLEIKLVKLDNAIFQRERIRNNDEEYGNKRVLAIENVDNLKKEISLLLSKAINQTREETIREVEWEIENWEIVDGKSFTSNKIKDILNKLKK